MDSWKVTVVTPGKIYKGRVFVKNVMDKRTIFVLNNSLRTTRSEAGALHLDHYLQLDETVLVLGKARIELGTVAINKTDILFVYDEFKQMGTEQERKRQKSIQSEQDTVRLGIFTKTYNRQCYRFVCGLPNPKQKLTSREHFLALARVRMERYTDHHSSPEGQPILMPFVALNKSCIESIHIAQDDAGRQES